MLLLGLLAMHGLASSHHGTPAAAAAAHAAAPDAVHAAVPHPADAAHAAVPDPAHISPIGSPHQLDVPAPSCAGDCPGDVAMLCLAVLPAAAAAAAAYAHRAVDAGRPSAPRACRAPMPRLSGRLLDPLADLCISRT